MALIAARTFELLTVNVCVTIPALTLRVVLNLGSTGMATITALVEVLAF